VLVRVPGHLLAGLVADAAEQHLLAADGEQPHAGHELERLDVLERPEG
jgi:hypothetical protein